MRDESKTRTFEEITIGECAELSHLLTQEDVDKFAALSGDYNPLHVDKDFARKTSFRKPVVHGWLSAAYVSTLIGMLLPGKGALWTSQRIDFLAPAFVGDVLAIQAEVKQKSPATRTLMLAIEIKNQRGEKIIQGESTVRLLELLTEEDVMQDEKMTILITGGSRGIGAATARRLSTEGHAVVINYHRASEEAQTLVDEIAHTGGRAMAIQADLRDEQAIAQMIERAEKGMGNIHGFVHCAAPLNPPQPVESLSWQDYQEQIDVQVKAAYLCFQRLMPSMVEQKQGSVVLVGSIYTDGTPPIHQSRYVVAKAALSALARTLAVEFGPRGIRVNVVSPGMTQTDMIATLPEKTRMLAKMQTPLRRLADPDDIGGTIAFLFSPAARHISGETIRVCGGAVMV